MPTDCKTRPQRDCSYFTPIPDDEIGFMQNFKAGELKVKAGTAILIEGANSLQLYTVLSGMACTEMVLCLFNRSNLWNLFKSHPGRAYDLT